MAPNATQKEPLPAFTGHDTSSSNRPMFYTVLGPFFSDFLLGLCFEDEARVLATTQSLTTFSEFEELKAQLLAAPVTDTGLVHRWTQVLAQFTGSPSTVVNKVRAVRWWLTWKYL
jgi:hypothetical protein